MLTFFGKCTGLSLTGVDARQQDDVELSSTSNGEIRPAVLDVPLTAFDVLLLTAVVVLTDKPATTAGVTQDADETAIQLVLALEVTHIHRHSASVRVYSIVTSMYVCPCVSGFPLFWKKKSSTFPVF